MKARTLLIAAAAMLFFAAGPARAAVIYNNGSPDLLSGHHSDPNIGSLRSDNFFLSADANVVTDIHWWGGYIDPNSSSRIPANPDNFTITFFFDAGGFPGVALSTVFTGAANRVATGDQINDILDLYEYWVDIDPLTLDNAGTTYWLSIVNDTAPGEGDGWLWATSSQDGSHHNSVLPTFSFPNELAFNLTGPIPEPSGVLLFSVGMLVVGRAIRRRSA